MHLQQTIKSSALCSMHLSTGSSCTNLSYDFFFSSKICCAILFQTSWECIGWWTPTWNTVSGCRLAGAVEFWAEHC